MLLLLLLPEAVAAAVAASISFALRSLSSLGNDARETGKGIGGGGGGAGVSSGVTRGRDGKDVGSCCWPWEAFEKDSTDTGGRRNGWRLPRLSPEVAGEFAAGRCWCWVLCSRSEERMAWLLLLLLLLLLAVVLDLLLLLLLLLPSMELTRSELLNPAKKGPPAAVGVVGEEVDGVMMSSVLDWGGVAGEGRNSGVGRGAEVEQVAAAETAVPRARATAAY